MKQLIGSDLGAYVFAPAARTVTLGGLPPLALDNVLLVTNVTRGTALYSFADPALTGTLADGVLTLALDTTAMDAADALQIWVDVPRWAAQAAESVGLAPAYVTDTNLQQVFGSAPLAPEGALATVGTLRRFPSVWDQLAGVGAELRIPCAGANTVAVQAAGTWAGTLSLQATVNGADFLAVHAAPLAGGAAASSATANGAWVINCSGLAAVRVLFTAWSSGAAQVVLTADAAQPMAVSFPASQVTADSQLPTILGATSLYAPALTDAPAPIVAPVVAPAQPTTYAAPMWANTPQRLRRLRVEAGGSERLPLAQEPGTNRLLVATPELFSLLEEMLLQARLTNQLLSQAYQLPLPSGTPEIN